MSDTNNSIPVLENWYILGNYHGQDTDFYKEKIKFCGTQIINGKNEGTLSTSNIKKFLDENTILTEKNRVYILGEVHPLFHDKHPNIKEEISKYFNKTKSIKLLTKDNIFKEHIPVEIAHDKEATDKFILRMLETMKSRIEMFENDNQFEHDIEGNAWFDLVSGLYNHIYCYSQLIFEEEYTEDLPAELNVLYVMCNKNFKGKFPTSFSCNTLHIQDYEGELPERLTCSNLLVEKDYKFKMPEVISDVEVFDIYLNPYFNEPISDNWNIRKLFINDEYYTEDLPSNYELVPTQNNIQDPRLKCYFNKDYKEPEYETDEEIPGESKAIQSLGNPDKFPELHDEDDDEESY